MLRDVCPVCFFYFQAVMQAHNSFISDTPRICLTAVLVRTIRGALVASRTSIACMILGDRNCVFKHWVVDSIAFGERLG